MRPGCRRLPKRANIARYGGDEFAILIEAEDPEETNLLKETIKEKLIAVNTDTGIPFDLTVSIGIASSDGSSTLKDLIVKADEDMYKTKRNDR